MPTAIFRNLNNCRFKFFICSLLVSAVLQPAMATSLDGADGIAGSSSPRSEFIADRYIVVLKSNFCASKITTLNAVSLLAKKSYTPEQSGSDQSACNLTTTAQALMQRYGGQLHHVYGNALTGFSARISDSNVQVLRTDPSVNYVTSNQTILLHSSGVRRLVDSYWLDRLDNREVIETLTDGKYRFSGTGQGVRIYSVDSGVDIDGDLHGRVEPGAGIVGTKMVAGVSSECQSQVKHGTSVMRAAAGDRRGVAPGAIIVPVRVTQCDSKEYFADDVVAGLDWIAANGQRPGVVNMSLTTYLNSQAINDAVKKLIDLGFVAVSSAGDLGVPACWVSPANLPEMITVGATDQRDRRHTWYVNVDAPGLFDPRLTWFRSRRNDLSEYGSARGECVTIHAPMASSRSQFNMPEGSGTSYSAAHVSGIAAILLERYPTANQAAIKQKILNASIPNIVGGLDDVDYGHDDRTPNRLASVANLFPLAVAIESISSRVDTSLTSWRPYVTIKLMATKIQQLPWNGAITIKGQWDTGDKFSCVVNPYTMNSANNLTEAVCEHKGPLMAKLNRRSARVDIQNIEGVNVTYDQSQNRMTSLFVRLN